MQIEVFYLPPYSPELNLDEDLNAGLNHVLTRKPPARNFQQLKRAIISHMRRLSPDRIRSFFQNPPVRYAV